MYLPMGVTMDQSLLAVLDRVYSATVCLELRVRRNPVRKYDMVELSRVNKLLLEVQKKNHTLVKAYLHL